MSEEVDHISSAISRCNENMQLKRELMVKNDRAMQDIDYQVPLKGHTCQGTDGALVHSLQVPPPTVDMFQLMFLKSLLVVPTASCHRCPCWWSIWIRSTRRTRGSTSWQAGFRPSRLRRDGAAPRRPSRWSGRRWRRSRPGWRRFGR